MCSSDLAFPIRIREHLDDGTNGGYIPYNSENPDYGGNAEYLNIGIEAGTAYVHGYEVKTLYTENLSLRKGLDTRYLDGVPIATAYGNYILVDDMCGNWDVAAGDTVDLRNAAANAVSSGSYSSHAAAGTKIGSARVRYIGHESGTVGSSTAQYRMYLYDITIDSGYNFDNIKSVYYNTTAKGHADVVLEGGIAVLKETKYNKLLFRLPTSATKTLKPGINQVNNFEYTKQFSASIASASNDVVISVSGDETFP